MKALRALAQRFGPAGAHPILFGHQMRVLRRQRARRPDRRQRVGEALLERLLAGLVDQRLGLLLARMHLVALIEHALELAERLGQPLVQRLAHRLRVDLVDVLML